jgi:putative tryptophan/tyrosine transport system substrate-binding protein
MSWSDGVVESWSAGSIRMTASLQYSNTPTPRPQLKFFWLALCAMLFALCDPVAAQQLKKVPRIGLLSVGADPAKPVVWFPFLEKMREVGYVEGQNIAFERRFGEGRRERLPELVASLVRTKVDIVVATGTSENKAAKHALPTTPIVMMRVGDPIGDGLINSLARPGGNVTGLTTLSEELSGKRLELLKEAIPRIARVALLLNPSSPRRARLLQETEDAVKEFSLQLRVHDVREREGLPKAFSAMTSERADALIVPIDAMFFNQRSRIVKLAAESRLAAIYDEGEFVDAGGLMAYGPSLSDLSSRAAIFVDKILKGRKPAELPVEQPKKFEFVINLKAAKQIGLIIPSNVLARADRVIR